MEKPKSESKFIIDHEVVFCHKEAQTMSEWFDQFQKDDELEAEKKALVLENESLKSQIFQEKIKRVSESTQQRQARRHQMCLDEGLVLPKSEYGSLPRGLADVAKKERISRQAFAEDVKRHIGRLRVQAASK